MLRSVGVVCLAACLSLAAAVVTRPDEVPHSHALTGRSRDNYDTLTRGFFARGLTFRHRLRVCNAYPSEASFQIMLGKNQLNKEPLAFKNCEEFSPKMRAGDKLDFSLGGVSAGSFAISDLPNNDAVLVLVIYRHDPLSTAVAFRSHVFANLINAQIAVLDTYKGTSTATLRIKDAGTAKSQRDEELRFDSVVAVNPGLYEIVSQENDGTVKARQELVALNRESYIVIRTGVEAEKGKSFAQEMMVFPRSDPKALLNAADRKGIQAFIVAIFLSLSAWLSL